jgi:hypothetical protein
MDATIYSIDGKPYGPCPLKLNIATNEVNFLNSNGEELTAQPGIIKKIIFHPPDSPTTAMTIFRNDFDIVNLHDKYKDWYVQELNQGDIQLLKLSKKDLNESDSLFGTRKKYSFRLEVIYFIKRDNKIHTLRKLSSKEILPVFRLNNDDKKWAIINKINFTKEKDVLVLLDYLHMRRN